MTDMKRRRHSPERATCVAAALPAVPAPRVTAAAAGARTVSVAAAAPFSRAVTVTCDAAGRTAAQAETALSGQVAVSSLAVAAGTSCARTGPGAYTCTIPRNGTLAVTATATGAHQGLSLGWSAAGGAAVATPTQTAVTPLQPSGFTRTAAATLSCTADGTVTVTATAAGAAEGAAISIDCPSEIRIADLADRTETGTGTVTVAEPFTVAPAAAACTATGTTGTPTVADGTGPADRTVSVRLAAGTASAVTVTCAYAGLPDGAATATLTARAAPEITGVRVAAASGGDCAASGDAAPAGVDEVVDCDIARDTALEVTVTADANTNGPALAWAATGAVTVTRSAQTQRAAPIIAPGGSLSGWRRTGTAVVRCARVGADVGNAELTVGAPGAGSHLTRLVIDCLGRVRITGLAAAAAPGTGTVTVARAFAVDPTDAACTATAAVGTPAVADGTGPGERTLSLAVAAGTTVEATVTCARTGYADAGSTVSLAAHAPGTCEDFIGVLAAGTTARTGTIAADAGCVSAQRRPASSRTYYARRHTFTLAAPASVTIDLGSASTNASTLDTYLLLLAGHDSTGTVIDSDDDGGNAPRASRITADLAAGDYTIEATTYRSNKTGDYTLTVDTAANTQGCTTRLGTLAAGQYIHNGNITADENCASQQRTTSTTRRHYANWYTLTLDAPAWVDIDLEKPAASSLDPYLILTRGTPTDGTVLHQDDNTGTGLSSQLSSIHLPPGNYTIEATSHNPADTGTHKLTLTIPIHGLPQQINTTIDQQTTIGFTYWPTNARTSIAMNSVSARESLRMAYLPAAGAGTLSLEMPIIDTHRLGLSYSSGTESTGSRTRSAARSDSSDVTARRFDVGVRGTCDPGEIVSPYNGLRCVLFGGAADDVVLPSGHGDKFQVTKGTLIGVDQAAREALIEYASREGPCPAVAVTETYLAAVLLSIPFKEIRTGSRTSPARSPMSLPRTDRASSARPYLVRLYSFDSLTKDPKRAFWHPSAGLWKIDDTFGVEGTFKLNHADRAHVITAAKHAAKHILPKLCDDAVVRDSDVDQAFSRWFGCHHPPMGVIHECRLEVLPRLYVAATGSRPEGLWVTTAHNEGDYSLTGGVSSHRCRWGVSGASFGCWFYDTDDTANRQGYIDGFDPEGDNGDNFVDGSPWPVRRSPLAAPFLSFNHGERLGEQRFVVFPHSLLSGDNPAVGDTLIKAAPTTGSARTWNPTSDDPLVDADDPDGDEDPDHSWEVNTYGQQALWVLVCPPEFWELGGNLCEWVSTNAGDSDPLGSFATRIRALGY